MGAPAWPTLSSTAPSAGAEPRHDITLPAPFPLSGNGCDVTTLWAMAQMAATADAPAVAQRLLDFAYRVEKLWAAVTELHDQLGLEQDHTLCLPQVGYDPTEAPAFELEDDEWNDLAGRVHTGYTDLAPYRHRSWDYPAAEYPTFVHEGDRVHDGSPRWPAAVLAAAPEDVRQAVATADAVYARLGSEFAAHCAEFVAALHERQTAAMARQAARAAHGSHATASILDKLAIAAG